MQLSAGDSALSVRNNQCWAQGWSVLTCHMRPAVYLALQINSHGEITFQIHVTYRKNDEYR